MTDKEARLQRARERFTKAFGSTESVLAETAICFSADCAEAEPCRKCYKCYQNYVAEKMAGELND